MRHLIVGTAGHIDHGKTTLVKALTGTDTDRLKEEKERGISIELGFAFLTLPDGTEAGIVDVPGHERFVKTMLAGVGGMDLVVLVIAADEGVMPQTREHLHICQLLQVKRGLVALTKADLVEPDWLEMVRADIAESLRGTFLEGCPIVPCSGATGQGLPELLQAISEVAAGRIVCRPRRLEQEPPALQPALTSLLAKLKAAYPELPNARWLALRLLAGDDHLAAALREGQLANLRSDAFLAPAT